MWEVGQQNTAFIALLKIIDHWQQMTIGKRNILAVKYIFATCKILQNTEHFF